MLLLIITFVLVFFIFSDLIPIYISKQWKIFWVYTAMLISVYVLTIFLALGIKIPSPAIPIANVINAIVGVR